MTFLCGDDWREFFDVIIVNARKPKFFTEHSRPLRYVNLLIFLTTVATMSI